VSDPNLDAAVEFADNPEARCPCVILVDTSGSMQGEKINALNEGLKAFKKDLATDPLAALRVEIALISFSSEIKVEQDFATVDRFDPPLLIASGLTHMGSAVLRAIETTEARKALYNANGVKYYRPWIFLITDGEPQGEDEHVFDEAARRVHEAEASRRVAFFGVGVEGANMTRLASLCTAARPPLKLTGLKFVEMFVWLSRSTQQVAKSKPDEQVALQPPGWGTV
jgi:uncharacterized protein YegL